MHNPLFLAPAERCPIVVLDDVPVVRVPLAGHDPLKTVKKRTTVAAGSLIATHAGPNVGDLHAPFYGLIRDVNASYIEIEALPAPQPEAEAKPAPYEAGKGPGATPDAEAPAVISSGDSPDAEAQPKAAPAKKAEASVSPQPVSFDGLDMYELAKALKQLGISVRPFTRHCELFIINALNPEPGMLYTQELLESYKPTLEAGLALLQRLSDARRYILALPDGSPHTLSGTTPQYVKPLYPISLARPLIRALTGSEATGEITLVRLHAVFTLGLVAESGLPLTHSVITALGKNYLFPIGTPVSTFFSLAGFDAEEGDSIIVGGAMRGTAIASVAHGMSKADESLLPAKKGSRPALEDNPCIGCGACVHVCPVRIRPNMLSRYAEFEQYEACRKEFIDVCIECGMCGYVCPACRPMQQYFRIAKHRLGITTFQHILGQ